MNATDKNKTYSLTEYASDKTRIAFVCDCKKCGMKLTRYFPVAEWLDIATQVVTSDMITKKEYFQMNHDAIELLASK